MKFIAAIAMAVTALAQGVAQNPTQNPAQNGMPQAAAPPPATGAISGIVIDGVSKEPIEDVTVALNFTDGKMSIRRQQLTDAKGRFVFENLPAGDKFTFTASAP